MTKFATFLCAGAHELRFARLMLCCATLLALTSGHLLAQQPAPRNYLIGNSLTWDTVPQRLDGDVQWHVDCGVSLPHIFAKPDKPCVKESTIWPQALHERQIAADIAAGRAPIKTVAELYRDPIHMTHDHGKYLMHNAMRRALGQPLSAAGFENLNPEVKRYLDGLLALLATASEDQIVLRRVLSNAEAGDRAALAAGLSDEALRARVTALLPEIERAVLARRGTRELEAQIAEIGGKLIFTPSAPQWLYLATGDLGTEVFDVPTIVDLYNGNNPLKGKGGRNEQVTDEWLERLSGLTTLRRLDIANCAIQGHGLRHIAELTQLRELNLTLTPVTDDGLKHLAGLIQLRKLGLASTQCDGTGFVHLKSLRKLEDVNFHFTPLSDAGLQAITRVPISGRFWFAHTKFSDEGASSLASLKTLKRCGIGSNNKASSGEAVAALTSLPLEDLSLLDNQATPAGIEHAAKIVTLKRLDISHAPMVNDESMRLVAQLPQLEEFRIGSAQVTDEGLQHLARSKSLKKVAISGLKRVTDAGIEELRKSRPELIVEVR